MEMITCSADRFFATPIGYVRHHADAKHAMAHTWMWHEFDDESVHTAGRIHH